MKKTSLSTLLCHTTPYQLFRLVLLLVSPLSLKKSAYIVISWFIYWLSAMLDEDLLSFWAPTLLLLTNLYLFSQVLPWLALRPQTRSGVRFFGPCSIYLFRGGENLRKSYRIKTWKWTFISYSYIFSQLYITENKNHRKIQGLGSSGPSPPRGQGWSLRVISFCQ